jgi:hypothetical protein
MGIQHLFLFVVYFTTLSVPQTIAYSVDIKWHADNKLKIMAQFMATSWKLPERTEKNHEKHQDILSLDLT